MQIPETPLTKVLSHKPFFFLFLGQVLSQLATNMVLFLLALLVYEKTGSNTAVSGLYIAYGIPSVVFGLVAGAIVDKFDKRKIIFLSNILRAVFVSLLLVTSTNIVFVYLLLFLNAMVSQFFVPAEATLIPKLTPPNLLVPANSLFSLAYYSSMAVGFIAAGPLLKLTGPYWSLGILSLLFVIAAWSSTRLPFVDTKLKVFGDVKFNDILPLIKRVMQSLFDGIKYMVTSPQLADSVFLLTGTQIVMAMLGTLGPGFADRMLDIDVRDASVFIIGPVVLGILVGAMWVGNKGVKYTPSQLIRVGIIGAGFSLVAVALTVFLRRFGTMGFLFADHIIIPIILVLFFTLGVFNSLLDVPANSMLQKEAEGDMRGRVYGILSTFVGGVGILPILVGGILADVFGVGKVIFLLGLVIILYGGIRLRYTHK